MEFLCRGLLVFQCIWMRWNDRVGVVHFVVMQMKLLIVKWKVCHLKLHRLICKAILLMFSFPSVLVSCRKVNIVKTNSVTFMTLMCTWLIWCTVRTMATDWIVGHILMGDTRCLLLQNMLNDHGGGKMMIDRIIKGPNIFSTAFCSLERNVFS